MTARVGPVRVSTGGASFTAPVPSGWIVSKRDDVALSLELAAAGEQAAISVTVQVDAPPCDPRAVAAQIARLIQLTTPAAVIDQRHFGTFGTVSSRLVALQMMLVAGQTQVQGVFVDDDAAPTMLFVVVASCNGPVTEEFGLAVVEVIKGIKR